MPTFVDCSGLPHHRSGVLQAIPCNVEYVEAGRDCGHRVGAELASKTHSEVVLGEVDVGTVQNQTPFWDNMLCHMPHVCGIHAPLLVRSPAWPSHGPPCAVGEPLTETKDCASTLLVGGSGNTLGSIGAPGIGLIAAFARLTKG